MERIPKNPPAIAQLQHTFSRPIISVMIPVYNCIKYLPRCLESVLMQCLDEVDMQIEVVDDASTDGDVKGLVELLGRGRIRYYRQESNVGSLRNFETCINRAKGEHLHILHGDDYLLHDFYKDLLQLFKDYPNVAAAFSNAVHIDESNIEIWKMEQLSDEPGILEGFLDRIGRQQLILTPSIIVKRKVYEELGGFCLVHYGEDWHMWIRIAAKYPIAYTPKILAHYRVHQSNISSQYFISGQTIDDITKVIFDVQKYLPQNIRKSVRRDAMINFCNYFAQMTDRIYHDYQRPDVALRYVKKILKRCKTYTTIKHYLKIRFKLLIGYKLPNNFNKTS